MTFHEIMDIVQFAGVLLTIFATFSSLRARDNERAERLAEIRSDIRYLSKTVERMETEIGKIRSGINKEYEDGRASA